MRLIIASNNKNKIREIKEILGDKFEEIVSMREAGIELDVEEDADSFIGNARKKAEETAKLCPQDAVLADDSGLCVDALNGAPGVYSARFAGEGHDDAANRAKLLPNFAMFPLKSGLRILHVQWCLCVRKSPILRLSEGLTAAFCSKNGVKTVSDMIICFCMNRSA